MLVTDGVVVAVFEMTVNLLDTDCSACGLALGLSHEQVGYVNPETGGLLVWHLACAPVELQNKEAAFRG